jgi:hypothetical protein
MLPIEIYKILAKLVETTKCYQILALLCKNSARGCYLYITEITNNLNLDVQIIYNFTGHYQNYYWHYEHLPLSLSSQQITDAINREHVGCNNSKCDQRCDQSRYYMSASNDIVWRDLVYYKSWSMFL